MNKELKKLNKKLRDFSITLTGKTKIAQQNIEDYIKNNPEEIVDRYFKENTYSSYNYYKILGVFHVQGSSYVDIRGIRMNVDKNLRIEIDSDTGISLFSFMNFEEISENEFMSKYEEALDVIKKIPSRTYKIKTILDIK